MELVEIRLFQPFIWILILILIDILFVGIVEKVVGTLEHGFLKYIIDKTEFLREDIKAKKKKKSLIISLR